MFKTQMYLLGFEKFVKTLYNKLGLPVYVRTDLPEKTMKIFADWVSKTIKIDRMVINHLITRARKSKVEEHK